MFEHLPTLPMSPPPPGMLQRGQTSVKVVREVDVGEQVHQVAVGPLMPAAPVWRLKVPVRVAPGL